MPLACSECFLNVGFRRVLARHGRGQYADCPRCGVSGGLALSREQLKAAAHEFFVDGSIVVETLAPYFQVNDLNPHPAVLDRTLAGDAVTLNELVGAVVFNYGPPLWQLGYTDHYHDFREGDPAHVADDLVRRAATIDVGTDVSLYRVRLNVEAGPGIAEPSTFDPPSLALKKKAGRWDELTSSVLYVADDIELCLHECRATLADEISLATLRPTRELHLLDISRGFGPAPTTRFDDGALFADFMSRSRQNQWLEICRAIGAATRRAGFDGVRYTSYYSFAMDERTGLNLALFGRPIEEGSLEIHSVNRVRLTTVKYGFGTGPVLYSAEGP